MSLKKNATRREDYIKMSASILACPHGYLRIARGFMGSMVMERLQNVEKENQELRDELRSLTPEPIDESILSYTPSTVVSTYIFCPVYLDTTEFRNIYNFAKSFNEQRLGV